MPAAPGRGRRRPARAAPRAGVAPVRPAHDRAAARTSWQGTSRPRNISLRPWCRWWSGLWTISIGRYCTATAAAIAARRTAQPAVRCSRPCCDDDSLAGRWPAACSPRLARSSPPPAHAGRRSVAPDARWSFRPTSAPIPRRTSNGGTSPAGWPTGQAAQAPQFGFQLTFFRLRTGVAADHPSRFAATPADLRACRAERCSRARELRHDQRAARSRLRHRRGDRPAIPMSGCATGGCDATARPTQSRYRARSPAARRLRARSPARDDAAAAAAGRRRTVAQGPGSGAGQPLLQPAATAGQRAADAATASTLQVRGKAWLDHEWSDSLLDADAVGWDWIGINLDDGSALTAFRLRRADGSALYAGGSWRAAAGAVAQFRRQRGRIQRRGAAGPARIRRPLSGRMEGRDAGRPTSGSTRYSTTRNSTAAAAPARSTGKA